ncbi:helix-turn-helix domain-containing protein [Thiobacillus denitrificans]|uniref:helix-turn-helix domain-containing protein n=1 Tax=Thiobacillus denitrificans TaxID=36861 RepID=UPI001B7F9914|nr:helix-turn-helix transcriptional regulator [Thiobacillus denitrificans]
MGKPPKKLSGRKLVWRVRVTMAERDIRTVTELVRRLEGIGVQTSVSQLGRLIDGKTKLFNPEIIEGLMAVLDCDLDGILSNTQP